jgi:PTS system fructose-specific IIC component
MAVGSRLRGPHGGIWVIGLIGNPFGYLLAIALGMLTTAGCVVLAKSIGRRAQQQDSTAQQAAVA